MQVMARASQHLTVRDVLSRLNGTKKSGNGWVALCPAHDDKQKSFSITEGDGGRVLLYCHARCTLDQICTALAIDSRSLGPNVAFRSAAKNSEPRTVDAIYD